MCNLGLYLLFFVMSTGDVALNEAETEWLYLAEILRDQTSCMEDPAEKLRSMTEWLHVNVKHVPGGRYPRSFNRKSIATVIQSGMGNCGYQSYNIVGFGEMLGFTQHRVLHHRQKMGAPGDHAHAEIRVDGRWIMYDPDKFLYFTDEEEQLLSVQEVAIDADSWIGLSYNNNAYKETQSAKHAPRTDFVYSNYEKAGMSYIRLIMKMKKLNPPVEKVVKRRMVRRKAGN